MNIDELFQICQVNGRRPVKITSQDSAVVAVCGMEGRLFFAHNGKLISLFRPEAASNISNSVNGYFNPGGDGLWPAPEGTTLGYEYSTGNWRVPTALTSAQYEVVEQREDFFRIQAEVDLINNQQTGIPARFSRQIKVSNVNNATVIDQLDQIEYLGTRPLSREEVLLAPWSLCQFCVDNQSIVKFGDPGEPIRDLYMPSADLLSYADGTVTMRTDSPERIQLALPEKVGFLELTIPSEGIRITRTSSPLAEGLTPVDIADAPVDTPPGETVRYSVYTDPSGFVELEAVGGCRFPLTTNSKLAVNIQTVIESI